MAEPTILNDPTQTTINARFKPRSSMFLSAVMHGNGEQTPVKVRNMSPNGAMVESKLALSAGTSIELVRGRLVAKGTVAWFSGNRCGLKFTSNVLIKDWLAAPARAEQNRVDEIVSLIKAGRVIPPMDGPDPVQVPAVGQPAEQSASDLEAVVRLIQDLEDDLASSPETLMRHEAKLQNMDIAMQMLRALAQQLGPAPYDRTSNAASLDSLRVACGQALGKRPGK